MMQCLPVNLDLQCEICNCNEYSEHESGFYVCCTCGTITQIRHGMGLDYTDINKGSFIMRKKIVNNQDEYDNMDTNNYDTYPNTMVNTCANSEYGDSIATHRSKSKKHNLPTKSLSEILLEHQKMFVNLFRAIAYIQFTKANKIGDFETSEYYKSVSELAKDHWKDFIDEEYFLQIKQTRPFVKNARSRRNTDEDHDFSGHKKRKKHSIRDQLKIRKVKNYNIENIDEYKDKKLKKKDKMNLFIEEYDQVKNHILLQTEFLEKEGISRNSNDALSFKNILKFAKSLNINLKNDFSYEGVIHQIFAHCGLNLISVYKESRFDESKSSLTPDNFLSIFYTIFNDSNINSEHKIPPLLFGELSSLYRSIFLNNLYNSEIKFLKYINKEKLLKLLDASKRESVRDHFRIKQNFAYICEEMLQLPHFFTNFCFDIYIHTEHIIDKYINHIHNTETFVLGIVIYLLKIFYGLNDLPYMTTFYNTKIINKIKEFELFFKHSEKDPLFNLFKQMPSLIQIIQIMKKKSNDLESDKILWESLDLKKNLPIEYKQKFVDYNEKFFSNSGIETNFNDKNIIALENKIKHSINIKIENHPKVTLKFSEKFLIKRNKMCKADNYKELKTFIKEEIEFYKNLEKKNKNKSYEIPLPCDTYVRFDKKGMKFDGITPPLSELIIMFYFSKLFKVDYNVLKKCFKNIEKTIEVCEKFK